MLNNLFEHTRDLTGNPCHSSHRLSGSLLLHPLIIDSISARIIHHAADFPYACGHDVLQWDKRTTVIRILIPVIGAQDFRRRVRLDMFSAYAGAGLIRGVHRDYALLPACSEVLLRLIVTLGG